MLLDHYSYSTLKQFETCPYAFYLDKMEKMPSVDNAFAQHGTLCHALIEEWAGGLLRIEDLPSEYEMRYPSEVTRQFPKFLAHGQYKSQTYDKGLAYFTHFDGFAGYEIVAAEKPFEVDLEGRKFVGIIDLILKDSEGRAIICDHKSKSLASFKKNEHDMYRQQYLYSIAYHDWYGEYPEFLMFNLFQAGETTQKPFDENDFNEAKTWAVSVMNRIETADLMDLLNPKTKDVMYCGNLCNVREHCENGH